MSLLDVFDQQNSKVTSFEIDQTLLSGEVNHALLWEVVKMQRASIRSGTASTKTRGQVSGSTRKIYRQKGTGNARHGDIKAPIFVGGGRVWGPHPRSYAYRMPKKARLGGLRSAFLHKYKDGKLRVVDQFQLNGFSTKKAALFFSGFSASSALLIVDDLTLFVKQSVRNLPHHKVLKVDSMNVYDLLNHDLLIMTVGALKKFQERVL